MNEELEALLKNYVTKEDLHLIFEEKRTASEQFLEDHDRSFRLIELKVNETVGNLNAGLSKLNIMSDALSQIMRVQSDNYEAQRVTQRNHEERIGKLEQGQVVKEEEYKNFYGAIFGDSAHPDQESIMAMLRARHRKADDQYEHMMTVVETKFDRIEARQVIIEQQIDQWKRIYGLAIQGIGKAVQTALPRIAKIVGLAITIFLSARIGSSEFMNNLGALFKALLGVP